MKRDRLVDCEVQTLKELELVWDEIGLSHALREEHYEHLMCEVENVYKNLLRQERNVRDQYRRSVEAYMNQIRSLGKAMDLSPEEVESALATGDQGTSLVGVYDALSKSLSKMTKLKEERFETIKRTLIRICKLELELKRPMRVFGYFSELVSAGARRFGEEMLLEELEKLEPSDVQDFSLGMLKKLRGLLLEEEQEKDKMDNKVDKLKKEIVSLCSELDEPVGNYIPGPSKLVSKALPKYVSILEEVVSSLKSVRVRRELIIHDHINRIEALWNLLEVPETYRREFLGKHANYSLSMIRECEGELESLSARRQSKIEEMVSDLKAKIQTYWDQLEVPESERTLSESYFADQASESTLEHLKTLASQLEHKVSLAIPIINRIKKRNNLLQEKAQLEVMTADPKRLLSKKASNLKQEERLRKRVSTLPNETATLVQALERWTQENSGERFIFEGKDYLSYLIEQIKLEHEEELREKENRKARLGLLSTPSRNSKFAIPRSVLSSVNSVCAHTPTSCQRASKIAYTPSQSHSSSSRHFFTPRHPPLRQHHPAPIPYSSAVTPSRL